MSRIEWAAAVVGTLLVILLLWAAVRDGNGLRRLASSGAQGLVGLLLVNATAGLSGVSLGFSWLSLAGCALLGLPGATALVLLQIILPLSP